MGDALREAAQAVLDRWDSPQWQWTKHGPTADLMHALRAALAQPAAPGWQWVPVEPTPEMLQATIYRVDETGDEGALLNWRAMLAAAPQAPQPGAGHTKE